MPATRSNTSRGMGLSWARTRSRAFSLAAAATAGAAASGLSAARLTARQMTSGFSAQVLSLKSEPLLLR